MNQHEQLELEALELMQHLNAQSNLRAAQAFRLYQDAKRSTRPYLLKQRNALRVHDKLTLTYEDEKLAIPQDVVDRGKQIDAAVIEMDKLISAIWQRCIEALKKLGQTEEEVRRKLASN